MVWLVLICETHVSFIACMKSFYFSERKGGHKAHLIFLTEGKIMNLSFSFFLLSISQGIGLAMDAFSVSLANGMNEPCMKKGKMLGTAGIFSLFQALMPFIGWICVSSVAQKFRIFEQMVPWIALALLSIIGGKMLYEGIKHKNEACEERPATGITGLVVQGIATSIDALSVGFTIPDYNAYEALLCCTLIGAVTFFICFAGIIIGKKAGTKLSDKAGIFGGAILIFIGLEIFITNLLQK